MKKLKPETKQKILKLFIITIVLLLIFLAIYLPLKLTGMLDKIENVENFKTIILEFGAYSYIMFFLIQFLQTTILPIPAAVTTVAGTLVFGPWITFVISFLSVFLGSLFAFFLGKKIGRKLVVWVAGEKTTIKWEEKLKQGKYVFFLMMLFPFFPDDILCITAGTINMNYRFFIITNLITRPITIFTICFLGSGEIIPFSGWGLAVWAVLIVFALIVLFLSFKYQSQIETYVVKLGKKLSIKNKDKLLENDSSTKNTGDNKQTEENSPQVDINKTEQCINENKQDTNDNEKKEI